MHPTGPVDGHAAVIVPGVHVIDLPLPGDQGGAGIGVFVQVVGLDAHRLDLACEVHASRFMCRAKCTGVMRCDVSTLARSAGDTTSLRELTPYIIHDATLDTELCEQAPARQKGLTSLFMKVFGILSRAMLSSPN